MRCQRELVEEGAAARVVPVVPLRTVTHAVSSKNCAPACFQLLSAASSAAESERLPWAREVAACKACQRQRL